MVTTATGRLRVIFFFLQVWQNVLCLLEYSDSVVTTATGRSRVVLVPGRRILIDLNMCASIFTQYGFDKDGLMPYVVFINVGVGGGDARTCVCVCVCVCALPVSLCFDACLFVFTLFEAQC